MTPDDLLQIVDRLTHGPVVPTAGVRHLYLWYGDPDRLEEIIPAPLLQRLDLYELVRRLPRTPYAADEARRLLRDRIEQELRARANSSERQVLVVSGCNLLARYNVPLQPFYSFASDHRIVILVVPRAEAEFPPPPQLPDFVRLAPTAPFDALSQAVGEKNVIRE
jgi:hypothetical protein